MKQTKVVVIAIIIAVIVVVIGVYLWQKTKVAQPLTQQFTKSDISKTSTEVNLIKSGPISYSITGVSVTVSTSTAPLGFTADQLKITAEEECETEHETAYFNNLVNKFKGSNRIIYNFKYQGISQTSRNYIVTLLPNKAEYTSLNQFRNDFNQCYAGGDTHPLMLNSDWLLFVNACGTGFDDESGRPNGCEEVKKIVEPSLKLN